MTATQHTQNMNSLKIKRDSTLKVIKGMDVRKLYQRMNQDAEGNSEPYNSLAYRELTRNRTNQGDELFQLLQDQRKVSYIPLLALRKINPDSYGQLSAETKVASLVGELGRNKQYNTWGLPHLYWEDAAKAVIELGKDAEKPLKALLKDKSKAPVWGGEEYLEYEAYGYRRCDYALAMLMSIRKQSVKNLPKSVRQREALIANLLNEPTD